MSPRAIERFSSARASRTRLARARACMCCGACDSKRSSLQGRSKQRPLGLLPQGVVELAFGRSRAGAHRRQAQVESSLSDRFPAPGRGRREAQRIPLGSAGVNPVRTSARRVRSLRATIFRRREGLSRSGQARNYPDAGYRSSPEIRSAGDRGSPRSTRAIVPSAPSRCSRSWVAIRLVRSSAPPGGTAGWIATLV